MPIGAQDAVGTFWREVVRVGSEKLFSAISTGGELTKSDLQRFLGALVMQALL